MIVMSTAPLLHRGGGCSSPHVSCAALKPAVDAGAGGGTGTVYWDVLGEVSFKTV